MKEPYKATIEKDLENHFIRKLDQEEYSSTENDIQRYLPHHPVKHPHKPGKVRKVCNAASKFRGVSLNDKLLSGPDLLRNLVGPVFRFREHLIAMSVDIESMFLQVAVPKEECSGRRNQKITLEFSSIIGMCSEQSVPQHVPIMVSNKAKEITKGSFL